MWRGISIVTVSLYMKWGHLLKGTLRWGLLMLGTRCSPLSCAFPHFSIFYFLVMPNTQDGEEGPAVCVTGWLGWPANEAKNFSNVDRPPGIKGLVWDTPGGMISQSSRSQVRSQGCDGWLNPMLLSLYSESIALFWVTVFCFRWETCLWPDDFCLGQVDTYLRKIPGVKTEL